MITLETFIQQRNAIEAELNEASKQLNKLREGNISPMGLVKDSVKQSKEYQQAKQSYDSIFKRLQNLNRSVSNNMKRKASSLYRKEKQPGFVSAFKVRQ